MSSENNITTTQKHGDHGTTMSYIIGFILSLVFTFIPYYMVVNHVLQGLELMVAILGFAMVQMVIQMVFFLHIGREKKPHWQLLFFASTLGIIFIVVVGSLWIMHHLHYNMTPVTPADASKKLVEKEGIYQIGGEETGACQGVHANHKVVIKDGQATPAHTEARECDTLTFVNEDDEARTITFGEHADHGVYAGEHELTVRKGRPQAITLSETGVYYFHDHAHADTAGSFTVKP